MKKSLICNKCKRKVPNKEYFTSNGCLWCDGEYHLNNKKDKHQ